MGYSTFLRYLAEAAEHLDGVSDPDKALKLAVRMARGVFEADAACFSRLAPGRKRVEPIVAAPQHATWDFELLSSFLGERRPKMPARALAAPVRRWGRPWGVLALKRKRGDYELDARRAILRVGEHLTRHLAHLDELRAAGVRERIDRKVLGQLRPNDLFYQILHGLRSLTHYDHSAAVLIQHEENGPLLLVAEQIAWRKGKSARVSDTRPLSEEARDSLANGGVSGFDLEGGSWRPWKGSAPPELTQALDYNKHMDRERREMCMICAPLSLGDGGLGALKIASCHPGSMGPYEAELVKRFLPQAAVALRNLQRTTSLETGMLAAERKHVVANIARGVSHDVNNAFGSVLPLVQQMLVDAREGRTEPATLVEDLEQIDRSLRVCRRIFGGMLAFGRSSAGKALGEGDVRRALDSMLAVLAESLRRHSIDLSLDLPETLPRVRGAQTDLEQLFLNVATNARDAMPDGGGLRIRAEQSVERLEIEFTDTGTGMPAAVLKRVKEPFFTTKRDGTGLGLSVCRSIVGNMKGELDIESREGEGTRVRVALPLEPAGEES